MSHWRSMFTSTEFLTSADLYDETKDEFRELTVTIERIVKVQLVGRNGKKDGRPGAFFVGQKTGKPLGLNATNCAAIANIARSPDMKQWPGTKITLHVVNVEIRGEGIRPAVRVKPFAASQQRAVAPPVDSGAPDDEELRMIAERDREEP